MAENVNVPLMFPAPAPVTFKVLVPAGAVSESLALPLPTTASIPLMPPVKDAVEVVRFTEIGPTAAE